MYDAKVQDEAKSRADACGCERRNAPFDKWNLHAGVACAFAGGAHRLRHDVDAGYIPPALSQANRPESGAAAEIKRRPIRRFSTALFSVKERDGLFAYGKGRHPFPRRHADQILESVEKTHSTPQLPLIRRRWHGPLGAPRTLYPVWERSAKPHRHRALQLRRAVHLQPAASYRVRERQIATPNLDHVALGIA
jgi:hypothetical protein